MRIYNLWFSLSLIAVSATCQELIPVVANSTGSVVQPTNFTATGVDAGFVFGREYLSHFHGLLMSGVPARVVFSGDSTTEGVDGVADPLRSRIDSAFKRICLRSLGAVSVVNAGHVGAKVYHWRTNYLAQDLVTPPDLYILRWGLNPNAVGNFESDLRLGLEELRSKFSLERMSVVLMTPNAANDPINGRDRAYLDSLNPIIRRAARDYQCVFIDLTRLFPESYVDPAMMDDPFGDGRRLHPRDVFNQSIASAIAEIVLPQGIQTFGSSSFQNLSYSEGIPSVDQSPLEYPQGLIIQRATITSGWPLDGAVKTERHADGVWRQENYAYRSGETRLRTGNGSGWNPWGDGIVTNPTHNEKTQSAGDTPQSFPNGVSLFSSSIGMGWPCNGQVISFRQFDGACLQFSAGDDGAVYCRTAAGNLWNPWAQVSASKGVASVPSAEPQAGAGVGASVLVSGNDQGAVITLTTGANPAAASTILRITWAKPWAGAPIPILTPLNGNAAALSGGNQVYLTDIDPVQMKLQAGQTGLTPFTEYVWGWSVNSSAVVTSSSEAQLRLVARSIGDQSVELALSGGQPGWWSIEVSTNLESWKEISLLSLSGSATRFATTRPNGDTGAFFRARRSAN